MSQTKDKLVSSEIKGVVETAVGTKLQEFLLEHPQEARAIVAKIVDGGRCNYISNGADRRDIVSLLREQAARFEGSPDITGRS